MPQAAVGAIGNFLLAVFGGTSAAATAAAFIAAKVFVYAATQYLLYRAAQSLTPRPKSAGLGTGTEINYYDSGAAVRIAYGLVKTGGMETIPPWVMSKPGSNANEDLHKVLTLVGHEVDSYTHTHFDTTTITNAQIGPMAFTSSDGMVTSGTYANHAMVRRYRGTSTDSVDRILRDVSSHAFGNSRARGIAKAAITLRFNADIYKAMPTITFTYQGKRCYDPRLDASPGADPTNTSFIVWGNNPALCLADYLMSPLGGSYDPVDIDWDTVVTAANYCDALVDIPGATTQKRYTCNGILFANEEFTENVKALVNAMLGRVIFRDGKWRIFAGSWQTPTFTVLKEDWISGLSIRFEQGKKKRFNQMRTWYVDPAREWQRMESLPRSNATYKTADGEESIDAETEQLLCTNEYEAQRKGEFLLRQSRNQITVVGRLPPRMQNIALWDTGTIVFDHLGWTSKTFRAVGIDMNPDGSMDCVFAEEQSSDWTDLDAADYNAPSHAPLPDVNVTTPSAPASFSATPQINGTILFEWTRPVVQPVGTEFQIIRSTNSSNAAVGTVVWRGAANPVPLVMPTSPHWYYVRAVANSTFSPYTPNTFGLYAVTAQEADNTLQNRLCGDAEFEFGAASSLWTGMNYHQLNNVNSVNWVNSYSPTGGQYGGYMHLEVASVSSIAHQQCALVAMTPVNSLGHPVGTLSTALEYSLRVRVHSYPATSGLRVGAVARYRLPSGMDGAQFVFEITSRFTELGQWTNLTATISLTDPEVNSISERYVQPAIFYDHPGNIDVDQFQMTNIGLVNRPVRSSRFDGDAVISEDLCMLTLFFINTATARTASFKARDNSFDKTYDWRRFDEGRRFNLSKPYTGAPVYIIPSSGMTLRLSGRTAVGTVTMVSSLPADAIIEKFSATEFFVTGRNLI